MCYQTFLSLLVCIEWPYIVSSVKSEITESKPYDPFDDPKTATNFALYYCHKYKTCTPGGDKVCAFDEYQPHLAEFEDMCTYYKANCKKVGYYKRVEIDVCRAKIMYEAQLHNFTQELSKVTSDFTFPTIFTKKPHIITPALRNERQTQLPEWLNVMLGDGKQKPAIRKITII